MHRLKAAAAAATTLLRLIFQCHNIAHTRPSPQNLSHLFFSFASHTRRGEEESGLLQETRLARRPATSPPQAMISLATSPNPESPLSWPGNRVEASPRLQSGGKQSYKAVIIRGERQIERKRGLVCWQEARLQIDPLVCNHQTDRVATRQASRQAGRQGTQPTQLHQPSPQHAPCNFPQTCKEIPNNNNNNRPAKKEIDKQE